LLNLLWGHDEIFPETVEEVIIITPMLLSYTAAMLLGFVLLVRGADRFVFGASATARNLGVDPLMIGLTIVGFATSSPEILVSVTAASQGAAGLAVGNAVGSNIANIGLVVGMTAVVQPLVISSMTLRREMALLIAACLGTAVLLWDGELGRFEGFVLVAGFMAALIMIVSWGRRFRKTDPTAFDYAAEIPEDVPPSRALSRLVIGLVVLMAGAWILVWGAKNTAAALGISDLVIGLSIVAVGTSLPELAVCIVSVRKGEHGLVLGNVIGSNIFNLLMVIGLTGVIHPLRFNETTVGLHYVVMCVFTLALALIAYNRLGNGRVGRPLGMLMMLGFFAYQGYLGVHNLQQHPEDATTATPDMTRWN